MDANAIRRTAQTLLMDYELTGWTFRFNTNKNRVGVCRHNQKVIEMSSIFIGAMTDAQILNVLTHEVAHALAGFSHGHDATWAAIHRSMGGDGKRCAVGVKQPADTYKWAAKCAVTLQELGRVNRKGHRLAASMCKCHRAPLKWVQLR
jgi:predicted SprT family Zn-dependent metalloprotease